MQIIKIKCEKCGHERIPRTENPLKCPVCGHFPGTQIRKKVEATPSVTAQATPTQEPARILNG